jgi:hypothetical protein
MEQCRDWNGEAYEAILLVGADKDGKSQEWATTKAIGMTDAENMTVLDATGEELQKALLLLEYCSLAMVQSLVNYSPPEVPSDATEEEKQRMHEATESRKARMQNFISALETKLVSLPKTDNAGPTEKYRGICKIHFSNTASDNLHPSPDPMLLVSRFAVVWTVRQSFRLRASAIVQDDYDEDEWEEDVHQLQVLESLNHERRLQEEVGGLEVTVEQSGLVLDSDDETISVSSGESQEGRDIMKNMENMERAKSANPNLKMAPLAPVLDVRRTAA